MMNLLKADFLKFRKDKTMKIILIIVVVLAVFTIFSNKMVEFLFAHMDPSKLPGMENLDPGLFVMNLKRILFSSFSLGNNIGILIPIALCLFIGCEFAYGTIRNKLIRGISRTKVYVSTTISASMLGIFILLVYMLALALFGFPFLKWGSPFTAAACLDILKFTGLGILIYLVSISITVFLSMLIQNRALAIVINVVVLLVLSIFTVVIGLNATLDKIFSVLMIVQSNYLVGGHLTNTHTWTIIFSSIIKIVGINLLGIAIFRKLDMK